MSMLDSRFDRSRWSRILALALVFSACGALVPARPVRALDLTLLASEANVSGSLTTPSDSWADSDQSFALSPSISVSQSFGTQNSSNSFVSASHATSAQRLRMSTRSSAGAAGGGAQSQARHDFTLRFAIDESARFELANGNSTGSFPVASENGAGASASLVYELRREGASTPVFSWAAPSSGAAGIYQTGVLSTGIYLWSAVAESNAIGIPEAGTQSAASLGNIVLRFEPAPLPGVPSLAPFGLGGLAIALVGMAVVGTRWARAG